MSSFKVKVKVDLALLEVVLAEDPVLAEDLVKVKDLAVVLEVRPP